jgi:plastocyanin
MKITYLLPLFVAALVLTACNQSAPVTDEATESTVGTQETMMENDAGTSVADEAVGMEAEGVMEENVTSMTIDMFAFGYSVEQITASPGETLALTLTNSGGMHDFDIDELNVDTPVIETGQESQVTFTIPADAAPGTTYTYYCSVGDHRAQGMEGTITVQ